MQPSRVRIAPLGRAAVYTSGFWLGGSPAVQQDKAGGKLPPAYCTSVEEGSRSSKETQPVEAQVDFHGQLPSRFRLSAAQSAALKTLSTLFCEQGRTAKIFPSALRDVLGNRVDQRSKDLHDSEETPAN